MRALLFLLGLSLLASPAAAVEAEEAKRMVQGSWTLAMGGEAQVFSGDRLDIYAGGASEGWDVAFESMPANMALLKLSSGARLVLHFGADGESMWMFPEGEEKGVLLLRLKQ